MAAPINVPFSLANTETLVIPLNRWGPVSYSLQIDTGGTVLLEGTLTPVNQPDANPVWATIEDIDGDPITIQGVGLVEVSTYALEAIRITATGAVIGEVMQQARRYRGSGRADSGGVVLALFYDFITGTTLAEAAVIGPTPTLTRTTTKPVFDSSGNLLPVSSGDPAFDHDPAAADAAKGILINEAHTNLVLHNRALDNAVWDAATPPGVRTQDQIGLDGVSNKAWDLEDDSVGTEQSLEQIISIANDALTRFSVIALLKDNDETREPSNALGFGFSTFPFETIELNTKTGDPTEISSSGTFDVLDWGNYWAIILGLTNPNFGDNVIIYGLSPAASGSTTGSVVADLPAAFTATKWFYPIESTTAPVTVNADDLVDTNLSWLNETVGGIMVEFSREHAIENAAIVSLFKDVNNSAELRLDSTTGDFRYIYTTASSVVADISGGAFVAGDIHKVAMTWEANLFRLFVDGVKIGEDTSGALVNGFTEMGIGQINNGSFLNGHVRTEEAVDTAQDDAYWIGQTT